MHLALAGKRFNYYYYYYGTLHGVMITAHVMVACVTMAHVITHALSVAPGTTRLEFTNVMPMLATARHACTDTQGAHAYGWSCVCGQQGGTQHSRQLQQYSHHKPEYSRNTSMG